MKRHVTMFGCNTTLCGVSTGDSDMLYRNSNDRVLVADETICEDCKDWLIGMHICYDDENSEDMKYWTELKRLRDTSKEVDNNIYFFVSKRKDRFYVERAEMHARQWSFVYRMTTSSEQDAWYLAKSYARDEAYRMNGGYKEPVEELKVFNINNALVAQKCYKVERRSL